jgi:hypothetical protein
MALSRRDGAIVAWHESAWDIANLKSRPVGYGLIPAGVRTSIRCPSLWEALSTRKPPGLAAPDHTVPRGRFLLGDASQALRARLRSVLSLRDEIHSRAEALIKLALMGLKPMVETLG